MSYDEERDRRKERMKESFLKEKHPNLFELHLQFYQNVKVKVMPVVVVVVVAVERISCLG